MEEIIKKELKGVKFIDKEDVAKLQRKIARKYNVPPPGKVEILQAASHLQVKTNIKKKPIRSLSGVAVVTVLTKEFPCPGKCLDCPREANLPKSYLSGEPAVERAKLLNFDPYLQVQGRIRALEKQGHPTDKIELIVISGTWSSLPRSYQTHFIERCFQAANEYGKRPLPKKNKKFFKLEKLQQLNEKAQHRIVGLTLETRPDWINIKEIERMRLLGCTRIELGVQSISDEILKINRRGHTVEATIEATKLLKDAGFKVCYHIMPGILGSNPSLDLEQTKTLFKDFRFRPDMLKIYPCVVTKGSVLYSLWKKGKYHPYTDKVLVKLLARMKRYIPPYVRILRVIRDIPSQAIEGGSKVSNLREVVKQTMEKEGHRCRCIRCREARDLNLNFKHSKLIRRDYYASGGKEVFLSFEDTEKDRLFAFLRLRLPLNNIYDRKDVSSFLQKPLRDAALIREIHTYGQLTPLGQKLGAVQHYGLGRKLVKEAENIARQAGYKKIAVISGIGVREYWRSFGYRLNDTYMVKKTNSQI